MLIICIKNLKKKSFPSHDVICIEYVCTSNSHLYLYIAHNIKLSKKRCVDDALPIFWLFTKRENSVFVYLLQISSR